MQPQLQYFQRHQIDTKKWDRCIDTACNGLIYACSWWLDEMARHWDALVWGDYEAVMPLTWNRKWGFRYLYQPPFTQQLGIFSALPLTGEMVQAFMQPLNRHFRFAEIFLNYAHPAQGLKPRTNFILPLHAPYELLRNGYKKDLLKNLKRAQQFGLRYNADVKKELVLDAYRQLYESRMPHVSAEDYARFRKVCEAAGGQQLVVRAVEKDRQLLCAALSLFRKNRMYLLHSVTWPAGRDLEANHFLLDSLIREFAQTDTILDFEGSDIPGIAGFYKNYGSVDQPYYFYRYNRLPAIVKWMKQ